MYWFDSVQILSQSKNPSYKNKQIFGYCRDQEENNSNFLFVISNPNSFKFFTNDQHFVRDLSPTF